MLLGSNAKHQHATIVQTYDIATGTVCTNSAYYTQGMFCGILVLLGIHAWVNEYWLLVTSTQLQSNPIAHVHVYMY